MPANLLSGQYRLWWCAAPVGFRITLPPIVAAGLLGFTAWAFIVQPN